MYNVRKYTVILGAEMSNFNILHLSDLHINSKTLSATCKKLIDDISKQTENMKEIIIIVSGDITNKGDYTKYQDGVFLFFTKLKEELADSVKDIFIVPGNHDKVRKLKNSLMGQLSQNIKIDLSEEHWNLQNDSYSEYLSVANKIYEIFDLNKRCDKTFGVEVYENGADAVCIIRLDTTWGCYGGKAERRQLIVGMYQMNSLLQEYKILKDKMFEKNREFVVTIVVSHHPISWLQSDEEELLKKYMIDDEYFNADLFLCGHIHDMEIENWFDHEHSVMTLVTGIGWDHQNLNSSEKDKKDTHRYSLYLLDSEKNSCEIIMRRSYPNGKFGYDTSIYTDKETGPKKLCYPLKISNYMQPFIALNSPESFEEKKVLVNEGLLKRLQNVSLALSKIQKKCVEILIFYKQNYLERLYDYYDLDSEDYSDIYNELYNRFFLFDYREADKTDALFEKEPKVTYEIFTTFLQEFSNNFVDLLKDSFPAGSNLRVHFRWYDQENDKYRKLCQYSVNESNTGPCISEIKWGGLIEQAYLKKKPFIYSVNKKYNNHSPVRWEDFMTIVPSFYKCEVEFRHEGERHKRPIISFGISVANDSCMKRELSEVLYILEFLNVDHILTEILDDFMKCFTVDYSKYLEYIRQLTNKDSIGDKKYD